MRKWIAVPLVALVLGALPLGMVARAQMPAGDFGNLARYRAENEALAGHDDPARVVFMGDSITQNWAREPYLRDRTDHIGRGISGQTAPQMLLRFRSDVIALHPAVVHIMAGTNDVAGNTGPETPDEIYGYIVSMVELARANGIRVVLAGIPPTRYFNWRPEVGDQGAEIAAINARLAAYAKAHRIVFVDYARVLADPSGR
ncbi:GDSL-type esterase/lipase family protein [Novosphingobium sp. 9]|uniref:GDSL-type esterase/lipase family protein n=1 Tax=Novosphingobium sp. 9 TaxID=2025349 RepID=UPI0021B249EF|nr:GDSL-type esterase/lipase family protein [Novosphingobium sp. 9]